MEPIVITAKLATPVQMEKLNLETIVITAHEFTTTAQTRLPLQLWLLLLSGL
jgi:hypothetical protein